MDKLVTLSEVFKKAQDCFTPTFNSVQFESDVDKLSKGETENLLGTIQAEILKGGDYDTLTEMRGIALDHISDIEKARSGVYADTAENRKLGRVGQAYGGKKNESAGDSTKRTPAQSAPSSDIGKRIISALKADQGGLNNSSAGKKAQMKIVAAAENFMKKNPKLKLSDEDLEDIVGGDVDESEEKYGELKGWNRLNDAIEAYFDAD